MSPQDRAKALAAMETETFDLAIIGGGITGAGVARDAASRGLKVALVEAQDFASGTSSRSSKLIHGGIRYLENMEFGLVFEALSERAHLFEMAPHLVHPLRFVIPVYETGRVPAWKMGLGMIAYDALSLYEAPELHQRLTPGDVAQEYPALQTKRLEGAFTYSDAYMDDDRLVHETLRAAHALGARIANYTEAGAAQIGEDGRVVAITCTDKETKRAFALKARHYVSSVGPWTDRLGESLFGKWKRKLRPSKGVHLTFLKERLPLQDAIVMGAEKRIVFAIPRHEMVIVGTTDTDFGPEPGEVRTEKEDVRYLLQVLADYFPGAKLTEKDIVACYAGVRPLIDDGAQTESKTSREHEIWTERGNVTFVAGGKYTTYRRMAEQTVNEALRDFPAEDRVRRGDTLAPLNPLVSEAQLERARREYVYWPLPEKLARRLADRHGMEGLRLIEDATAELPPMREPEEWVWCAEALHAVRHTMCLHLVDFYVRRSPLVLARPDHGLPWVNAIAATMAHELGWSIERKKAEINALQNRLQWDLSAIISG